MPNRRFPTKGRKEESQGAYLSPAKRRDVDLMPSPESASIILKKRSHHHCGFLMGYCLLQPKRRARFPVALVQCGTTDDPYRQAVLRQLEVRPPTQPSAIPTA